MCYTGSRPWEDPNDPRICMEDEKILFLRMSHFKLLESLKIPYDWNNVKRKRENLIANRGPAPTEPTDNKIY